MGEPRKTVDIVVGAGEPSNIILDDEFLSRQHVRVTAFDDGTVYIEDLGTTNGTWVNGVRIYKRRLRLGDRVRIGHTDVPIPTVDELLSRATVQV